MSSRSAACTPASRFAPKSPSPTRWSSEVSSASVEAALAAKARTHASVKSAKPQPFRVADTGLERRAEEAGPAAGSDTGPVTRPPAVPDSGWAEDPVRGSGTGSGSGCDMRSDMATPVVGRYPAGRGGAGGHHGCRSRGRPPAWPAGDGKGRAAAGGGTVAPRRTAQRGPAAGASAAHQPGAAAGAS